jgi:hypothetical protein
MAGKEMTTGRSWGPKELKKCQSIVDAIAEHGPLRTKQIRALTGITPATYEVYIRRLLEERIIYVREWIRLPGNKIYVRVFDLGDADNAPRPSNTDARRRYLEQKSRIINKDLSHIADYVEQIPLKKKVKRFAYED